MALKQITAPTLEPVTTSEAKSFIRVTTSADDTLIGLLIKAAREHGENITRRAWMTQTWELTLDGFPSGGIVVPLSPLQSVTSVRYTDTDGTDTLLAAAEYSVDDENEPGLIVPAYGETWPTTRDEINAVRVRYICGWTSAANIPEALKIWLKIRVGTIYEQREALVVGQAVAGVPRDFIDGLLDSYRVWIF